MGSSREHRTAWREAAGRSRSHRPSWHSRRGITKGTQISMKNVSSASACLTAASHLPYRDGQRVRSLDAITGPCRTPELESWLGCVRAGAAAARAQGSASWDGRDPSDPSLISKAPLILKDIFKRSPRSCSCHSLGREVPSPPMGTATAREVAGSRPQQLSKAAATSQP